MNLDAASCVSFSVDIEPTLGKRPSKVDTLVSFRNLVFSLCWPVVEERLREVPTSATYNSLNVVNAPTHRSFLLFLKLESIISLRAGHGNACRLSRICVGFCCLHPPLWSTLPRHDKIRRGIWLGFEWVRSAGNLDTIIRSAQATGTRGIIFLGDGIDPFAPRVIRPTMGAIFHQELIRTTPEAFARWKRRVRCSVIGTSAEARQEYRAIRYDGPTVIMMGSERKGLSETQRDLCDSFVRIPMRGRIDSLNLAVAASVILHEVWNQRNPVRWSKSQWKRDRKVRSSVRVQNDQESAR